MDAPTSVALFFGCLMIVAGVVALGALATLVARTVAARVHTRRSPAGSERALEPSSWRPLGQH